MANVAEGHRPANGVDEASGHFFEDSGVNTGFQAQTAFFTDGRAIVVMQNFSSGAATSIALYVATSLCQQLKWTCGGKNLAPR